MAYTFDFDHPHEASPEHLLELLGSKGANLAVMKRELGLPVPPGFTVSTEACREYLGGSWPEGLDEEIRHQIGRLENTVGRRFGGPGPPLLVSVRSGAPASMPGMMDTILNLGLNDTTTSELATGLGDRRLGADCRRRLERMYLDIVGVDHVPDDPWQQLREAMEAVFRSWNSHRAQAYRAREDIPDDLGTAVTVQAMVFGNWGENSATGVAFTRDPATGENKLYGEVVFSAQGEDVVSGQVTPEPIEVLDKRMPPVAEELRGYAKALEEHYRNVCDIEFTVEQHKLWLLQVRIGKRSPQAALRVAVEMAEDDGFSLTRAEAVERVAQYLENPPLVASGSDQDRQPLATGLPASPGLASGEIATTSDTALSMAEAGRSVILVRPETSPNDVHGMARAVGILTSRGGLACHAAVVARAWGIPAVVGASAVSIDREAVSVGDLTFAVGDVITIDGSGGRVFAGAMEAEETIVPEAKKLLAWAREIGIDIGLDNQTGAAMSASFGIPTSEEPPTVDTVIRALLIKGLAAPEGLAPAVLSTPELLAPVLESMTSDGVVEESSGMLRLTEEGKTLGLDLIARDREEWGPENAIEALNVFLPIDNRVKETVTAWQLREVDGEQVINDHSDASYDASVLAEFASLHDEAAGWRDSLSNGLPRLHTYSARLNHAAASVARGEHQYLASPQVDSYHNIWFELHEDLILLAGRTREDEVAAGRA